MPDSAVPVTPECDPLDAIIASYLQQVEIGEAPDRVLFCRAIPSMRIAYTPSLPTWTASASRQVSCGFRRIPIARRTLRIRSGCRRASGISVITSFWKRSPGAVWAWSTRLGKSA